MSFKKSGKAPIIGTVTVPPKEDKPNPPPNTPSKPVTAPDTK